jgi:hypothetical protein
VSFKSLAVTQAITLGKILSLDLIAPFPTSLPDPPISLVITYDDGVAVSSGGGGGIVGEDGAPGESFMIPGIQGPAGAGSTGPAGPQGATGLMDWQDGVDGDTIMVPGVQGPAGATGPGAIGKQTIYIPASAMLSATTNGPSTAQLESATNKLNYSVLDFDGTTQEYAHFRSHFLNVGTSQRSLSKRSGRPLTPVQMA